MLYDRRHLGAFATLLTALLAVGPSLQQADDSFAEELFLKPLPSGHINSFFQFSTSWELGQNDSLDHIHLVARPLAEIVQLFDIAELHVSLTHGLWRHDQWGYPPVDAAMGAEVWAWFTDANADATRPSRLTHALVDAQWKRLVDTLSGLLCASLTFIDSSNTLRPKFSFRPQFSNGAPATAGPGAADSGRFVRYATLPREIVCTENLTPWKKLLPCRQRQAGLVSLLSSGYIHSTNYHSIGLHLRTLQTAPHAPRRLELKQTANLVYDKALISSTDDWSMRKMFGQGLAGGSCYLAASSHVYVDVTEPNDEYVISPPADRVVLSQRGGSLTKLAEYDLKTRSNGMFHLSAVRAKPSARDQPPAVPIYPAPPVHLRRFLLGAGQERGQIFTRITNTHWAALPVLLHENLPWFVPAYLHTLRVRVERTGELIEPAAVHYVPGLRRTRAGQLELAFAVPARSTVTVTLDIDYIHLKWLEYPPDANHGHYIGAATLTVQLPVARNFTAVPLDGFLLRDAFNASRAGGYVVQLRTESLLITLPTPDFSMPYNVICLACTVVALAFGPLHNIATKRIALVEEVEDEGASGDGAAVTAQPIGLLGRLRAKLRWSAKTTKPKSE